MRQDTMLPCILYIKSYKTTCTTLLLNCTSNTDNQALPTLRLTRQQCRAAEYCSTQCCSVYLYNLSCEKFKAENPHFHLVLVYAQLLCDLYTVAFQRHKRLFAEVFKSVHFHRSHINLFCSACIIYSRRDLYGICVFKADILYANHKIMFQMAFGMYVFH